MQFQFPQLVVYWFSGMEIKLLYLIPPVGLLYAFAHLEPNPTLQHRRFHNLSTCCTESITVPFLRFKPVTPKYGVPLIPVL